MLSLIKRVLLLPAKSLPLSWNKHVLECKTCIGVWQKVVASPIIKYSRRIFFLIQIFLCYFTYPQGLLSKPQWSPARENSEPVNMPKLLTCSYGYQRTDQNRSKCSGTHSWISDLFPKVLLPLKYKLMNELWGDLAKETRMGLFQRAKCSCGLPVTQAVDVKVQYFILCKIYVFLLFPQLCLISKKIEVVTQRYSYELNFVIFNCVLRKFWWIRDVFFHLPSWLLLRGSKRRAVSLTWNQNAALLFKAFCSEKQWKLQGSKGWEKGAAEIMLDLWQTLLWKWDNLELQGWTRNRRQGMKLRWKKYSRRMKHIKDNWERRRDSDKWWVTKKQTKKR